MTIFSTEVYFSYSDQNAADKLSLGEIPNEAKNYFSSTVVDNYNVCVDYVDRIDNSRETNSILTSINNESSNDIFKHIIAEVLTFNEDSVCSIADRIARSQDSLTHQEIDRLVKMAIMTSKAVAQKVLTRANMCMATDKSGNLSFSSVLSELAVIKARTE